MAITSIATIGAGSLNVYFGTDTPPTLTDNKTGEEYYVTSDGTIQGDILERWVYSGTSWFKTDQAVAPEALTTLSFDGFNLIYVDESGTQNTINISAIDTAVTSASFDPLTSQLTFTNSDSSQFSADLSSIAETVGAITLDMTGFPNRTDSELLYNEATSVLTLQPKSPATEFTMYYRGRAIVVSTPLTVSITQTGGGRYIVYNTITDQLEEFFPSYEGLIKGELLVSYVYLDGTNTTPVIFGDERHSSDRDTQWHLSKHLEQGAVWRDGGILAYTLNDDTQTGLSFSTPISVADEDVVHSITHSATPTIGNYEQILESAAELPVLYYLGADFTQMSPTTGPFIGTAQTPKYNLISAGSGSLADAPNNAYINYWVIYTNDSRYPVKLMLGQNAHSNLNDAEAENFSGYDLPLPEIVVAYKVITQHSSTHTGNDAGLAIVQVNMVSGPSSTMSQFFTTDSHANLTGRNLADQHSISSITGLQTVLDSKLEAVAVTDITDTDVETLAPVNLDLLAFDEVDSTWKPAYSPKVVFRTNALAGAVPDLYASRTEVTVAFPTDNDTILWMSSDLSYGVAFPKADGTTKNPYYTADGGLTWYPSTSTYSDGAGYGPNRVFELGSYLVVGFQNSGSRFMTSADNGITWNTITTASFYYWHFYTWAYFKNIDMLFQTTQNRVTTSYALGTTFDTLSETITVSKFAEHPTLPKGIILDGNNIHQVTGYNTFVKNVGVVPGAIIDLRYSVHEDAYIAAAWDATTSTIQLYKSGDDGVTWTSFGSSYTAVSGGTYPMYQESHEYGTGQLLYRFRNQGSCLFYDIIADTWSEGYWDINAVGITNYLFTEVGTTDYVGINQILNGQPAKLYVGEMETAASIAASSAFYPLYTIDDLDNTDVATKQDGEALVWDATASKWVAGSAGVTVTGNYGNVVTIDSTGSGIEATSKAHVDPTTGFLGINNESPERAFDAYTEGPYTASMRLTQFNDSTDGGDTQLRRARGTIASPLALQDGDEIGSHAWFAYDGTVYDQVANLEGSVVSGSTTNGGLIRLNTQEVDGDGQLYARLSIAPEGNVTFNEAFTFPIADGANGQVLITNGSGSVSWQALPSGVTTLAALDDTDVTTITPGNDGVLLWNGTDWVPGFAPGVTYKTAPTIAGSVNTLTSSNTGEIFNGVLRLSNGDLVAAQQSDNGGNLIVSSDNGATWASNGVTNPYQASNFGYWFPYAFNGYILSRNLSNNIVIAPEDFSSGFTDASGVVGNARGTVTFGSTEYFIAYAQYSTTLYYTTDAVNWQSSSGKTGLGINGHGNRPWDGNNFASNGTHAITNMGDDSGIVVYTSITDSGTFLAYPNGPATGIRFTVAECNGSLYLLTGTTGTYTATLWELNISATGWIQRAAVSGFAGGLNKLVEGGDKLLISHDDFNTNPVTRQSSIYDPATQTTTDIGDAYTNGIYNRISDTQDIIARAATQSSIETYQVVSTGDAGNLAPRPYTIDELDDTNVDTKVDKGALIWDDAASEWRQSSFPIGKPIFCNVKERWDDAAGTSVSCEDEAIYNLDMAALGNQNLGIDVTGLALEAYLATSVTFICDNSSTTGFIVNTITIDSTPVTLLWQGGSAPTGTASGHDIVTFSIMRMPDNSYKAFGNSVSYS